MKMGGRSKKLGTSGICLRQEHHQEKLETRTSRKFFYVLCLIDNVSQTES